tara:strand:+ start:172 stop:447 length:276 start_codon:yes stop_codon:yes gene_type:complete
MKTKFRIFPLIEFFLNVGIKLVKNKYNKKGNVKKIYSDLVNSSTIITENKKKSEFRNFSRNKNINIKTNAKTRAKLSGVYSKIHLNLSGNE